MTKRRDRFQLRPAVPVEYYWLVQDQDFQRQVRLQGDGYYFSAFNDRATAFLSEQDALDFIARVKPPSERNPLVAVRRVR